MGSDGVIATISSLDYLFVPIKADRLVLESTLNFTTTINDRLIKTYGLNVFEINNKYLVERFSTEKADFKYFFHLFHVLYYSSTSTYFLQLLYFSQLIHLLQKTKYKPNTMKRYET